MTVLVDDPYSEVNWNEVDYLHSMSHQHTYRREDIRAQLYDMGFRHFPITEYYPSEPTYPLPGDLVAHGDAIGAPNAEHHAFTDAYGHYNTLGSFYTTGYGKTLRVGAEEGLFTHSFEDLAVFDAEAANPGEGVYRLDLRFEPVTGTAGEPSVTLSIEGAEECDRKTFERVGDGRIQERTLGEKFSGNLFIRVVELPVKLTVEREPETTQISQLRLMQGANLPWRRGFTEALDGDRRDADGNRIEGLLYPEGGGITINHPWAPAIDGYLEMLDFDDRVLGVEVWNHRRWFGLESDEPHTRYYEHWDAILRTGRRCLGFFVKDHRQFGRGRNILLVNPLENLSGEEREREALRAYREGRFFGVLGATNVDEEGRPVNPYDHTDFRFTRIEIEYTDAGDPSAVYVAVAGHDKPLRPNLQLRFVTDRGLAEVVDNRAEATYALPRTSEGDSGPLYVRVEALAYPDTHKSGQPLDGEILKEMNVYEISRLHDWLGDADWNDVDEAGHEPIPIVDMLFSQPIRFIRERPPE